MSRPLRPIAFVLAASNHGSMIVNRNDYLVNAQGGIGVGYEVLNYSACTQNEVDLVLQLLDRRRQSFGKGVLALDCGANIGTHTVEYARFMHGWGEVIAFEAQERIFYALAGNIALNNCFNARALYAAVGASRGHINVPVPDYLKPGSYGSLEIRPRERTEFIGQPIDYAAGRMQPTTMIAIDELRLGRVDLIKIDVEGMEIDVLTGARATLEASKPILLIEHIKSKQGELRQFVEALGYRIFPAGINYLAVHASDPTVAMINVGAAA